MAGETNPNSAPMNGEGSPHIDTLMDGSLDSAAELYERMLFPETEAEPKPKPAKPKDDKAAPEQGEGEPAEDEDNEPADTDNAAEEGEEGPTDAELDIIELEGQSFEVPVALKKAFEEGTLRQSDYTQKTQALADRTRVVDASALQAQVLIEHAPALAELLAEIKIADNQLKQYSELNWQQIRESDAKNNTNYYSVYSTDYNTARMNREALQKRQDNAPAEFEAKVEKARAERRTAILPEVKRLIPDWDTKGEQRVIKAGKAMGFTVAEMRNGALDPRILQTLDQAGKYQELQESKPQINKRVQAAAPKVVKPGASVNGARRTDALSQAEARFAKTHSQEDAIALQEQKLLKGGYK